MAQASRGVNPGRLSQHRDHGCALAIGHLHLAAPPAEGPDAQYTRRLLAPDLSLAAAFRRREPFGEGEEQPWLRSLA
jgi:hypothetical protein